MRKPNWIGIPAGDIDRIIDKAIRDIGTGEETFSCCALVVESLDIPGWAVRKAYTNIFGPVVDYQDSYGYAFSTEVARASRGNFGRAADLRVFMLSLFRVAWRDLV